MYIYVVPSSLGNKLINEFIIQIALFISTAIFYSFSLIESSIFSQVDRECMHLLSDGISNHSEYNRTEPWRTKLPWRLYIGESQKSEESGRQRSPPFNGRISEDLSRGSRAASRFRPAWRHTYRDLAWSPPESARSAGLSLNLPRTRRTWFRRFVDNYAYVPAAWPFLDLQQRY